MERNPEARVTPDFVVNYPLGKLRSQDEMEARAPTEPRDGDDFIDELGLLLLQFPKLVADNEQVRQRLGHLVLVLETKVTGDVARGDPIDQLLATASLRLQ